MYVKSVSFVTCFAERYLGNSPMVVKRIDAKFRIISMQCKKKMVYFYIQNFYSIRHAYFF